MRDLVEDQKTTDSRELASWRRIVLPFAILVVLGCAIFFAIASYTQFTKISTAILASSHAIGQDGSAAMARATDAPQAARIAEGARLAMRGEAQRADLSRASSSLVVSLWTRNMGFTTGMILALVGAIFVLARLDDSGNELSAETGSIKGTLKTSSPGIVLAVLGTVLMVVAMTVRYSETLDTSEDREVVTAAASGPRVTRSAGEEADAQQNDKPSAETCGRIPSYPGCAVGSPVETGQTP